MATRGIVWLDGLQARKAVVASARGMRSVVLIYGRYCLGATAPNGSALVCPGVSLAPGLDDFPVVLVFHFVGTCVCTCATKQKVAYSLEHATSEWLGHNISDVTPGRHMIQVSFLPLDDLMYVAFCDAYMLRLVLPWHEKNTTLSTDPKDR